MKKIPKLTAWDFHGNCGVEPSTKTHMKLSAILANQHNIIDALNLMTNPKTKKKGKVKDAPA